MENTPPIVKSINATINDQKKTALPDERIIDGSEDQERMYLIREEYRQVIACIQRLNPDERDIISLVANGDLSYREIARIIGITENNVKVKVHRARLKLREMMHTEHISSEAEKYRCL